MRLQGDHIFHVSREALWALLFDPARLARALPGCERFEQTGPGTYALALRISLPVLKGLYQGVIVMDEAVAPARFRLRAEAQGPAGHVDGAGTFVLAPVAPPMTAGADGATPGQWTRLSYSGEVQFSGMLRLLGAQVVSPAARAVIDRFFGRLEAEVRAAQAPPSPAAPSVGPVGEGIDAPSAS